MPNSRLEELRGKLNILRSNIREKEVNLEAQEQKNIHTALISQSLLEPYEERMKELGEIWVLMEKKEGLARAELFEAEEEGRLINESGAEHENEMKVMISDSLSRAQAAEQANFAIAAQFEDEAFSIISRIAVFEKRKAELLGKLSSLS